MVLLFTPHIVFLGSLFGVTWPGLPSSVITIISVLTLTLFLAVLFRRVTNPVMRMLSNFDDYFSWFITMLVMVTGLAATAHIGAPYQTLLGAAHSELRCAADLVPLRQADARLLYLSIARHQRRPAGAQRSDLMSNTAGMLGANLAPAEARHREARVAGAMSGFAQEIGALSAFRLESCIHCGICADACHFYIATEDPQYTPIWKVEPFKQAYKREASAIRSALPAVRPEARGHGGPTGAVAAPAVRQLQHVRSLQPDLPDGHRCRRAHRAGAPRDVRGRARAEGALSEGGAPAGHRPARGERRAVPRASCLAIGARFGVEIPLDKPEAEVMLCVPRTDIEHYPSAVAALARVMQHLGVSCTFRSDGLVAENYGYYAGGKDWQREISLRLIDQAIACKAKILLVPECGHAYTALRWEAADLYGKPLPFKVRQVTEFLADELQAGRLKLRCRRRRRDDLPGSLPAGAQGWRQRCAAGAHEGDGRRAARNEESRRLQFLLRRRRRSGRHRARRAAALPDDGEQAARDRRHGRRDLSDQLLGLPAHLRRCAGPLQLGQRRRKACWSWWPTICVGTASRP